MRIDLQGQPVKINSPLTSVGNLPDAGRTRSPAGPAPAPVAGERVDISALSARLHAGAAGEAPLDVQRIAEIKQAIAAGQFRVDPDRIAGKLLDGVREMLSAKR